MEWAKCISCLLFVFNLKHLLLAVSVEIGTAVCHEQEAKCRTSWAQPQGLVCIEGLLNWELITTFITFKWQWSGHRSQSSLQQLCQHMMHVVIHTFFVIYFNFWKHSLWIILSACSYPLMYGCKRYLFQLQSCKPLLRAFLNHQITFCLGPPSGTSSYHPTHFCFHSNSWFLKLPWL